MLVGSCRGYLKKINSNYKILWFFVIFLVLCLPSSVSLPSPFLVLPGITPEINYFSQDQLPENPNEDKAYITRTIWLGDESFNCHHNT
jgi:hypothetical protein